MYAVTGLTGAYLGGTTQPRARLTNQPLSLPDDRLPTPSLHGGACRTGTGEDRTRKFPDSALFYGSAGREDRADGYAGHRSRVPFSDA